MSDAVMLTTAAVALVAMMIFLVRRNRRRQDRHGATGFFEMMFLKPVAFLDVDIRIGRGAPRLLSDYGVSMRPACARSRAAGIRLS